MANQRRFIILCVDDEEIPLIVRTRVLEKAGHEVISATSGAGALEILESRSVDLVLTDLLMPGMTGAELAQRVKRQQPSMPLIIFSGVNEFPPADSQADLFLSKLEGPDFLCEKVAQILRKSQRA